MEQIIPDRTSLKTERADETLKPVHGLIMVNTGHGKGKTTAAMGLLLRAWGHGKNVLMFQFIKNAKANFGEHKAARKMGIEIIAGGAGFARPGITDNNEKSEAMAADLWKLVTERITSGVYDMIVLDELSYPLQFGWLDIDDVLNVLRNRPEGLHVVITGRDMPEELIELADVVTESVEVKHHFKRGIKAQPGIEF